MEYLKGRGLRDETIRKFGLGYSDRYNSDLYRYLKSRKYSDEVLRETGLFNADEKKGMYDKFWNRVIYPIMDANSRVHRFRRPRHGRRKAQISEFSGNKDF